MKNPIHWTNIWPHIYSKKYVPNQSPFLTHTKYNKKGIKKKKLIPLNENLKSILEISINKIKELHTLRTSPNEPPNTMLHGYWSPGSAWISCPKAGPPPAMVWDVPRDTHSAISEPDECLSQPHSCNCVATHQATWKRGPRRPWCPAWATVAGMCLNQWRYRLLGRGTSTVGIPVKYHVCFNLLSIRCSGCCVIGWRWQHGVVILWGLRWFCGGFAWLWGMTHLSILECICGFAILEASCVVSAYMLFGFWLIAETFSCVCSFMDFFYQSFQFRANLGNVEGARCTSFIRMLWRILPSGSIFSVSSANRRDCLSFSLRKEHVSLDDLREGFTALLEQVLPSDAVSPMALSRITCNQVCRMSQQLPRTHLQRG